MVFSSLLFLCLFFPAVLLGYFALQAVPEKKTFTRQTKNRICNLWLLLASLFFYAWGEPKYLFLMAATALVDYGAGLLLERMGKCGNTRGKVLIWDIKQFFHKENQTIVEWYFKNKMDNGSIEEFDGISLVEWTPDNKIKYLKEFGCNLNNYNPYQNSDIPQFKGKKANWF